MDTYQVDASLSGIRKSPPTPVTAAAANTPQNLWLQTAPANLNVPDRTVILRKIHAWNNVGATTLTIGTGLGGAFAAAWPPFQLVGVENIWTEDMIAEVELGANLTFQTDVLGVIVTVEVEERT